MEIYKITNLVNGKIYIGKDTTNSPNYFGSGVLILRSIKKYGIDNFTKEIIDKCEDNVVLCEKEKYWIEFYKSYDIKIGYNISKGGDGGDTFSNNPNKLIIREKISKSMKIKIFTETHRKNLSKNHMSTKYKKGKTYEEIYGKEQADKYKNKLKLSRQKYKTEKERLGDNYDRVLLMMRDKFTGDNNPMKKKKYLWYINPTNKAVIRIPEGELIPEGFIRGRKIKE